MSEKVRSLAMTSPPDDVDTVHGFLEPMWAANSDISLRDRISFETALIELASNVMRHADPGNGVRCQLDIVVREATLEATLIDSGKPGKICIRGRDLPDEMAETGRGIPLIRALVDVFEYDSGQGQNRWYISRARTSDR